jgi:hypothetical protein
MAWYSSPRVIEAGRRVGMFWPKNLLADPERFLVERLGFGVVPDPFEKEPEYIQGIGILGILRTPSALCHFNRSFRNGNRLLIFSLFNMNMHCFQSLSAVRPA